jgi:hypothetical protein
LSGFSARVLSYGDLSVARAQLALLRKLHHIHVTGAFQANQFGQVNNRRTHGSPVHPLNKKTAKTNKTSSALTLAAAVLS